MSRALSPRLGIVSRRRLRIAVPVLLLALVAVSGTLDGVPDPFDSGNVLHQVARVLAPAALASPFAFAGCLLAIGVAPSSELD